MQHISEFLVFSFFPYLCSRANPELVLVPKSLNVLKPYTKQTKGQSQSEGQPKFFCATDVSGLREEEEIDACRNYLKTTGPESLTEEYPW